MIENIAGLVVLFVAFIGGLIFLGVMPPMLVRAVKSWRSHRSSNELAKFSILVTAFVLGGTLSWNLIPFHWDLSFWTTIHASIDAETFGHLVEHKAEGILIWVLFFSVVSAAATGLFIATLPKWHKHATQN